MEKKQIGYVLLVALIILCGYVLWQKQPAQSGPNLKIGIITALTGDVAYWGESTMLGAELAKRDLAKEGIAVDFIFDDARLDPKAALDAVQKQVNVDHVRGVYSEFNPSAIAVTSYIKDKDILHIYDAAPVSPLADSINTYKTFTDFEAGCRKTAELLKSRGVARVGVLKNNLEFGQLCVDGVKNVYGDAAYVETYNPDTTDFRTLLSKLKGKDVGAIFVASFTPDQLTALKNMKGLGMDAIFVGTTDLATPELVKENGALLERAIVFGLPVVSRDFSDRLKQEFPGTFITNEQAAGLAYVHLTQMARALHACGNDMACVRDAIDGAPAAPEVGFHGFKKHIADFDVRIDEFKNGNFVELP